MSTMVSPGVYDRIVDRSFVVNGAGLLAGGIVISAKKGSTDIKVVTSAREFIEEYGVPSRDNPSMYAALRFLNRAGTLSVKRVVNDAQIASGVVLFGGDDHLEIEAANPGAWGNDLEVEIATGVDLPTGQFLVIVKLDGEVVETFEVSRDENAKNGFGNNVYIENVINARSSFIRVTDNPSIEQPYALGVVSLAGGSNDTVAPTTGSIVAAWDDFLEVDTVPAQLLINGGWTEPSVQTKMLAVAKARKDAVAILDVPEDTAESVAAMIEYRKVTLAANTEFGGIYGGWLRVYDQYNDREVTIPPSGDVAAIFAYTVSVAERWDAPAGLQRGIIPNALGVSKAFTQGERDQLYLAGINPVTTYGGASAVVWGQKTLLVQNSSLKSMNVVNSVIWINYSMASALQPFVFQPNTANTRDSVNFLLSSFLENIKVQGGLFDYAVDTSDSINTAQVIDTNQLLVDVYLKPTRTAEFIRLSTIITPTGVQLG